MKRLHDDNDVVDPLLVAERVLAHACLEVNVSQLDKDRAVEANRLKHARKLLLPKVSHARVEDAPLLRKSIANRFGELRVRPRCLGRAALNDAQRKDTRSRVAVRIGV